jgi:hypothetical protein
MKRFFLSCLIGGATLALAACASGGGGSGAGRGGDNYNPAPVLSLSAVSAGAGEVGYASADLSETSQGTQDGLQAGVDLGDGYTLREGSLEITKGAAMVATFETGDGGDVKLYENGILSAFSTQVEPGVGAAFEVPQPGQNIQWIDDDEVYAGSLVYTSQALWLNAGPGAGVIGNGAVNLEHSTFGAWALEVQGRGSISDANTGAPDTAQQNVVWRDVYYMEFYDGDNDKKASPNSGEVFSGRAIGMAYEEVVNDIKELFLTGTATLNINSDNVNNGAMRSKLALEFDGFYNIDTLVDVWNTGEIGGTGWVTITDNNNATGIELDISSIQNDYHGMYVSGQMYGDSGTASEAVGRFLLYDDENGTDTDRGLVGSFGVKK